MTAKKTVAQHLRTRHCLNCMREGGSHDDELPKGWLTWSIGGAKGNFTLGWACSKKCVMALLRKQVSQFYKWATAPAAASGATTGTSGSRPRASTDTRRGCTTGVATKAVARVRREPAEVAR